MEMQEYTLGMGGLKNTSFGQTLIFHKDMLLEKVTEAAMAS